MTDKDIVDKAAKMLGGITKTRPKKENRKQVYSVEIFSSKAAAWMMTLYTLMGERRKETIETSLNFWKAQRFKNKNGMGRKNPRTKREREENEAIVFRHRNKS